MLEDKSLGFHRGIARRDSKDVLRPFRQRGLDQRRWEAQQRAIEKQRCLAERLEQAIVRTGHSHCRRDDAAEIMRRENQELLEQAFGCL